MNVPMINGREVIKNNIPGEKAIAAGSTVKPGSNNETANPLQKIKNIKRPGESKEIFLENSPEIALKFDLDTHIEKTVSKNLDHKLHIEEVKLYQHEKVDPARLDFPLKKAPGVKPFSKEMPVKPKINIPVFRKRVTA